MQSYKSLGSKDVMSWPDVHFYAMLEIFKARSSGDNDRFEKSVTALDILLAGFVDEDYTNDMAMLNNRIAEMSKNYPQEQVFAVKMDEKAQILSRLVYRINIGRQRMKEFIENSLLVKEIAKNIVKGIGQNVVITGPLGSGKSESGIKIAQEVSRLTGYKWAIEDVVFTPLDFVRRYNDKNLTPKGSDLIFDEIGITHNARTNQSKANIQFNKIFQILRHRELLCIFTLPDLSILDITARKLMHYWLKTESIDKKKGLCFITPHVVEVDQRSGDILYPFPVFNGNQLSELRITQIDEETRAAYKRLAGKYKDDVGLQVERDLKLLTQDDVDPMFEKYKDLRDSGVKTTKAAEQLQINHVRAAKYRIKYDKLVYLDNQSKKAQMADTKDQIG